VQVSLQIEYE